MRWTGFLYVIILFHIMVSQSYSEIKTSVVQSKVQAITVSPTRYTVTMGGSLDRTNCITRTYARHRYAFHPDLMLAIENRGTQIIHNPRITINGYHPPRNIDEMLTQILDGVTDPQEKIYRIWHYVRENRHHDYPVFGSGKAGRELHDPVKYMLIYGGGFCDDSGSVASSLFHRAGFQKETVGKNPIVRTLHGHVMSEVFFNGDYQFMDTDENPFYLDRENEHPVSGDRAARDLDLVHREPHYGPIFNNWERSQAGASLFGDDDGFTTRLEMGHEMNLDLRPGERIEYLWTYRAGYPASKA